MRAVRAEYPGSFADAYLDGPSRWQVSYFSRDGKKEIGQVIIAETTRSPKVLEQWTGFQVAWTMARGYPGAFGRHVNALYVWLPLCLLFVLPFLDFRRPFSLLHLDLLVLLSFSVSLAFFNHAHIYASVPLVYPPLLYLLARMLALSRRERRRVDPAPLRLLIPAPWLALGVVFLIGFRIALNVTDSNVIDVGYAGVIGAQRIVDGKPLYGSYPSDNEHGDTYGPVNYEAYVPFEQIFGWSGTLGRSARCPRARRSRSTCSRSRCCSCSAAACGARHWESRSHTPGSPIRSPCSRSRATPTTRSSRCSCSRRCSPRATSRASALSARGAMAALAGLTKFAPLALAPLFATHGLREQPRGQRRRAHCTLFVLAFLVTAALASIPALTHDSLHEIYQRTIAYQANRGSPFSVWGLYGGLGALQQAVQVAAVALALALAILPRRPDLVGLAAACAAVIIATQLGIDHWFYLYIPWFFPLTMIALLGRFADPRSRPAVVASAPARWSRPAAAASSGSARP